jgi:hypothetical protein
MAGYLSRESSFLARAPQILSNREITRHAFRAVTAAKYKQGKQSGCAQAASIIGTPVNETHLSQFDPL